MGDSQPVAGAGTGDSQPVAGSGDSHPVATWCSREMH